MAKEYIVREAAIREACKGCNIEFDEQPCEPSDCYIRNKLLAIPAADVKEVVHGVWIYHEGVSSYDGSQSGYSCSNCSAFVDEEIFDTDEFHKAFCGSCGADMREGQKE